MELIVSLSGEENNQNNDASFLLCK